MIKKLLNNPALLSLLRQPDFVVHHKGHAKPYLTRWYILPRNRWLNAYLHRYDGSDLQRALHDHEYISVSFLFSGEIMEHRLNDRRLIPRFLPVFRSAKGLHRLELLKGPAFTLFITGPRIREWGFYYRGAWYSYHEYFKQLNIDSDYKPVDFGRMLNNNSFS